MSKPATSLYSPELRERAVRMLHEHRQDHSSRWAAIGSVAAKIGCTPQTIDNWTKRADGNNGERHGLKGGNGREEGKVLIPAGLTREERERMKALERENKELRQANELLRKAASNNVEEISGSELNRREQILSIASKSFLYKGYLATSIDEIAEAAGTSGPALYRLFDSKQDILNNICLIGTEIKLKGVQKAIARGHPDPKDTLCDLVKNRIEFAFGPWGCQVPITAAEYQHLSAAAATRVDTAAEFNRAEWFRCLAVMRPETPTPRILSVIYAVIMEITYVGLHVDELSARQDIRPTLQRVAWAGLMS